MNEDDQRAMRDLVLSACNEPTFLQLTWKAHATADLGVPWRSVLVRPVEIRGGRHLQFSHFDARRNVVKNWSGIEAEAHLVALLEWPFASVHLQSTTGDVVAQQTRKGRIIFHRSPAPTDRPGPSLEHNRRKDVPLPVDRPDPFLHGLGIMDDQGRVRPSLQNKFHQINEFLKLVTHAEELQRLPHPVRILDCGCGSALLTLALHHYCNDVLQVPTLLHGVDANGTLVAKCAARARELGALGVDFETCAIADYRPDHPPDIVVALHACDTATDEAIAQGIRWDARLILCAPCCHHDLHQQLEVVAPFAAVWHHGILRQRLADILTDTFRALALRILGYSAEVIEFVSTEHTDRNLLIRAAKRRDPGEAHSIREYQELRAFWGVTPAIERLLGERLAAWVGPGPA